MLKFPILLYSCPVNKNPGSETINAHLIVALIKLCIIFRHGLCFSFNGVCLFSFTFYILYPVRAFVTCTNGSESSGWAVNKILLSESKLVIIYYWHVVKGEFWLFSKLFFFSFCTFVELTTCLPSVFRAKDISKNIWGMEWQEHCHARHVCRALVLVFYSTCYLYFHN